MLTLDQIVIEENKQEIEQAMVILIGLNLCNGICTYVFERPTITVDKVLNATKKLSNPETHRIIYDFWGDRTSH